MIFKRITERESTGHQRDKRHNIGTDAVDKEFPDPKDEAHSNYLESLERYWDSYYTLRLLCGADF